MLHEHLGYVADAIRRSQFAKAIADAVKPGDRVADLGCGSGVLGLLALQQGASHLYAIDDSAMIEIARETFARAGYAGRVTLICGRSQQVDLPERVDVAVCDHVGYFGFDYGVIEIMQDAKARFLKPGGSLIPAHLRLSAAVVASAKGSAIVDAWQAASIPPEYHWVRRYSVNTLHGVSLDAAEVLGPAAQLGELSLDSASEEFFSWRAKLLVEREGVANGVAGWFDCELAAGTWMTNSPLAQEPIDRPQAFLPIEKPVPVRRGDTIDLTIAARLADRIVSWEVKFPASRERFSHSSWQGMILPPQVAARARDDHVARLNSAARARLLVLSYCDGKRTVAEVSHAVMRDHPKMFPSAAETSMFVSRVLAQDIE